MMLNSHQYADAAFESHDLCVMQLSLEQSREDLPHLFSVDVLIVWTVHHLVAVVLFQHLRVIAYALNVQVLPLVVKAVFLQSSAAVSVILSSGVILRAVCLLHP